MAPQQEAPQIDTLYQGYGKNLYKTTGEEGFDSILDIMDSSAPSGATTSTAGSVQTSASDVGSGVSTSTSSAAAGSVQSGKTTFDNTVAGYILGVDPNTGVAKFYIGNSSSYINWDGTTLTVVGSVAISQLNIPNTTTANSFHVDDMGNAWWGTNVATGYATAPASILNTGAATFSNVTITGGSLNINGAMVVTTGGQATLTNVAIGGSSIQYQIQNTGILSFGDGSDGAHTCDGSTAVPGMTLAGSTYTMTRDVYFSTLTINTGVIVKPSGYRIFCSVSLTIVGTIARNGNNGGNGTFGALSAGGTAGAAVANGYLVGSPVAGVGQESDAGGLPSVPTITNSIGVAGGQTQGSALVTASNVKLIANWHLATLLDVSSTGSTIKFTGSNSSEGGGASGSPVFGSGGGGGSSGGIIAIYATNLTVSAAGVIQANGGVGGNGGGDVTSGPAANGGNGGSGGVLVLVYNTFTNAGSIQANAGLGGAAGPSSNGSGSAGVAGNAGIIYEFNISL